VSLGMGYFFARARRTLAWYSLRYFRRTASSFSIVGIRPSAFSRSTIDCIFCGSSVSSEVSFGGSVGPPAEAFSLWFARVWTTLLTPRDNQGLRPVRAMTLAASLGRWGHLWERSHLRSPLARHCPWSRPRAGTAGTARQSWVFMSIILSAITVLPSVSCPARPPGVRQYSVRR
jgi:hypothetical protein